MSLTTSLLPLKDALRYSRRLRHVGGWLAHARGLTAQEPAERIARLTRALTMLESPASRRRAVDALHRKPGFDDPAPWEAAVRAEPRYAGLLKDKPHLTRSVILKAPGPGGEKGLLLMTFEYNWARLLLGLDAFADDLELE